MSSRTECFSIDRRGALVRSVSPRRGKAYEHRCVLETLKAVSHRFDEHGEGDTIEVIAEALDASMTQVATAIAFLLERGIIAVESRRNYPATIDVHLDAMTEYHALRESTPA